MKIQIRHLIYGTILLIVGSLIFKTLPEHIYGKDILFDASRHVMTLSLGLFYLYYFIQRKENWKLNYVVFSSAILVFIGIQRILSGDHNEYGVLMGYALAALSIFGPLWLEGQR